MRKSHEAQVSSNGNAWRPWSSGCLEEQVPEIVLREIEAKDSVYVCVIFFLIIQWVFELFRDYDALTPKLINIFQKLRDFSLN